MKDLKMGRLCWVSQVDLMLSSEPQDEEDMSVRVTEHSMTEAEEQRLEVTTLLTLKPR
jgi:hypothetical protein